MWLPEEMEMLTPEPSEMKPHVMVNEGGGGSKRDSCSHFSSS